VGLLAGGSSSVIESRNGGYLSNLGLQDVGNCSSPG
jgi:hypothetical protein